MRVWNAEATIPAAAITLATGNDNNQPILFTTQFGVEGTYTNPNGVNTQEGNLTTKLQWAIKSVEVTLVRDWNTSQAMIVLACNLPNVNDVIPPLPDVSAFRGGNHPYLTVEDEIRIYQGYIESPTTPITGDLLDDIPFDFQKLDGSVTKQTPSKPLVPVFWGFIDKVEFSGNAKGLQILLSCRDRTRVFADTRIISLPGLQGSTDANTADANGSMAGFGKGDRAALLMQLANGASGNNTGEAGGCSCWKAIQPGLEVRGWKRDGDNLTAIAPSESPSTWTREACLSLMSDKAEPRFHRWTERPPIQKGESNAVLQILNKTPLEIIDYLAKSEERPIDFYSSHVNGDFIFGPRSIDMSGFEDETRSYRTYFFKGWPSDLNASPPAPNQMISNIRTASSTLATFNKFIIIDSQSSGGKASLLQSVQQGLYALPWSLDNRKVTPPCRTQIIYDAALATYDNPDQGALIVGLAQARIWARDINGIQITLVGDPTFFPGEAIRVYNSVLHDNQTYVIADEAASTNHINKLKAETAAAAETTKSLSQQDKSEACQGNAGSQLVNKLFNQNPGAVTTSLKSLILPIYKVRTVQHKLTADGAKRGFQTTIVASADF